MKCEYCGWRNTPGSKICVKCYRFLPTNIEPYENYFGINRIDSPYSPNNSPKPFLDIDNVYGQVMKVGDKDYRIVGSYENDIGGGPCTTYIT